jgi:hypothetical protein
MLDWHCSFHNAIHPRPLILLLGTYTSYTICLGSGSIESGNATHGPSNLS